MKKYKELVCTTGLLEDGSWIRLYPIQFRKKSYTEQYQKYHWIEVDIVKNREIFDLRVFVQYLMTHQ